MLGANVRRNYDNGNNHGNISSNCNKNGDNLKNPKLERAQSDVVNGGATMVFEKCRDKDEILGCRELEKRTMSNLERFLEAIIPSVRAQYLSKTTMRGLGTCDVEFQPYFFLSDLWDSFKEWSAYGAGVPLMLNGCDSVVQYYVPYLSGIQIYVDPSKPPVKSRRTSEDSEGDYFSRDSSSDGSSDSERDRALAYSGGQHNSLPNDICFKMERLLSKDQHSVLHEGFSSDEGDSGTHQGSLFFQYIEQIAPFRREPLADKISDLALRFPELKSLRSCDILSSSWLSVAWYPIYRIPMGPTLKDLDACFLTYHSLHTPVGDSLATQTPELVYLNEIDGTPRMSLPVYGLSSYKFRGPLWISDNGSDRQLMNSLLQAADSWLRLLQVNHHDYLFFSRNR